MRLDIRNGARTVEAVLDSPAESTDACVVACPPHPQHRGSRTDERLRAVSDALTERGGACLRIDYGPWDEGRGERDDAVAAVRAVRDRGYDRTALFGYSFGAAMALLAARSLGDDGAAVDAVAVLAPPSAVGDGPSLDPVAAFESLDDAGTPLQVVYGSRDTTVEWEPVVDAAQGRGVPVVELAADHFLVGQAGKVADAVAPFLVNALRGR